MLEEFKIRKKATPELSWIDCWSKWGIRLEGDSKDLHSKGKVVAYEYQFVNSNARDFIAIKDDKDKVVREVTTMSLSLYSCDAWLPSEFTSLEDAWEDFVEYISGEKLEIASKAGGLSNFFTLDGEIKPTPTYGGNGYWTHFTCGINFKQLYAK